MVCQEHRTQESNYFEAMSKMQGFIDTAAIIPKERVVEEFEESEH